MAALALDGGGVRGLITAAWLEYLDEHTDKPLLDYFDVVAGTSAGSINAMGLALGLSGRDVRELFQVNAPEIFPWCLPRWADKAARIPSQGLSSPKYGSERLVDAMRNVFGERLFGDAKIRCLVTTYSMTESRALILDSANPDHADLPMWKVVAASSAAPVFFPAMCLKVGGVDHVVVDGGVAINDPALTASTALREMTGKDFTNLFLLSLGTGHPVTKDKLYELKGAGLWDWGIGLVHFLLTAPSDHTDYVCRRLHGDNYHRVQVRVPYDEFDIDDASKKNLERLLHTAASAFSELDPIVEALESL